MKMETINAAKYFTQLRIRRAQYMSIGYSEVVKLYDQTLRKVAADIIGGANYVFRDTSAYRIR